MATIQAVGETLYWYDGGKLVRTLPVWDIQSIGIEYTPGGGGIVHIAQRGKPSAHDHNPFTLADRLSTESFVAQVAEYIRPKTPAGDPWADHPIGSHQVVVHQPPPIPVLQPMHPRTDRAFHRLLTLGNLLSYTALVVILAPVVLGAVVMALILFN